MNAGKNMANRLRSYDQAVAIVTGGASGIGRALSEELAARGCSVVIADIDGDDAETLAAALRKAGRQASARQVDVTRYTEVSQLVSETFAAHGRLDYLFNNAGIGSAGEVLDYTLEAWTRVIDVNLNGVVHGVHAAYPAMVRQGYGHIVNTASMAGLVAMPSTVSYSASKHAVVGLSKALRIEAQGLGVRVTALCPGVIRTPLLDGGRHGVLLPHLPEERQRRMFRQLFEQLRPMDAQRFARQVLDQVARNVAIIIVPGWWKLGWWIERLSPGFSMYLGRKMFERNRALLKSGA